MKNKTTKKKLVSDAVLIRITIIMVIFSTAVAICRFHYFTIYTKCWHLFHSEQIEWNGFDITIPGQLISLTSSDENENEEIRLFYYKKVDEVSIYFSNDYPLKLEYKTVDKVMLSFILAPRVENE